MVFFVILNAAMNLGENNPSALTQIHRCALNDNKFLWNLLIKKAATFSKRKDCRFMSRSPSINNPDRNAGQANSQLKVKYVLLYQQ
ncbi:MAG: hypothetical protein ACI85O_001964 [Saprospiraceae bacterium]|jgi:hypothetical protein